MKCYLKCIALILTVLLLLSAPAACTGPSEDSKDTTPAASEDPRASQTAEVTTKELHPHIEKTDYATEFLISNQADVNEMDYHWVEESAGDAMSEAVYNRQQRIRDYLGVELFATYAGSHTTYTDGFKTAVKNKDDSVHLLMTHVHSGIPGLINGKYLQDFNKIPEIDLSADYWSHEFMEDLSLAGRVYLGNSRFNILYTHVIAFNKPMMTQYEDSMDSTVYEMVDSYQWTLDQMIGLANRVYIDVTSDGKTEDDTFGIAGTQWIEFIGFLHASDINIISQDESGTYAVSVYNELNNERTAALIEKLSAMVKSDSAWFRYRAEKTPLVPLHTGRALMTLEGTTFLPELCNYDIEFGILPYPMFDESQKDVGYRHLQWGGYLAIPSYLKDPQMVGETVELLAYFSDEVNTTFYEKLLGKQVADIPADRKILEMVWDTICAEFGQAYCEVGESMLYMMPQLTWEHSSERLASYVSAKETVINKAIKKFIANIEKRGDR